MTSPPRPMGRFQNNFTGMFLGWPFIKIAKMVLLCWTKWPPELKIEKLLKQHLLQGQLADFKIISQKCSLEKHCSNCSTLLNKVAARAKNRKTRKMTSPPRPIGWIQHNLVEMFFGWPSTKIAKMVPLRWTKWPSELKIEKPFKRHLLFGQWANFKIISPECSLEDPLPVLLKWFCSTRAKNKK